MVVISRVTDPREKQAHVNALRGVRGLQAAICIDTLQDFRIEPQALSLQACGVKIIPLLGFLMFGMVCQGAALAQVQLDLALVEFGGVIPDVVKSGAESVPGIELSSATKTDRIGSGPLKGGNILFTQTISIRPGETIEQVVRMANKQVHWSGQFGGMQSGKLPVNLSVSLEVGTDETFRSFSKRTFEAAAVIPLGKTIVAQSRQSTVTQKKFSKREGYTSATSSRAFLLLVQAR